MIAAVDIGGTKIAVGMVDDQGNLLARLQTPTLPERGYLAAAERIFELLRQAEQKANCTISGIGIGCTGPVDPDTGHIGTVNHFPDWEGQNPVRYLAST
jgi:glucokinase